MNGPHWSIPPVAGRAKISAVRCHSGKSQRRPLHAAWGLWAFWIKSNLRGNTDEFLSVPAPSVDHHSGLDRCGDIAGIGQCLHLSLAAPRTVAIDRSYYDRLGVSGVGATAQIRGLPVTVGAITDGIRSFTTTPYVFSDLRDAWAYTGLPTSFTSHFLVRLKPEADIERTRQNILSSISGIQALTPDQFREQSRSFWLFRTGAGAALVAGALLGVIVGTVIVAQTLYSSTKDHLYEFATLRAMGASNSYIYRVIICQALVNAVIGFAIAALIGNAVVHFTKKSALQVVITPGLMAELFVLTIVMCIVSAITAIYRVVRVDPAIVLTR